jgi:hypothetical protein
MNARLNVTFSGQNGDLTDPILYDATDEEIRQIAEEAIRNGSIPGIDRDEFASLEDFVVDRFPAGAGVTENRLLVRPKTPFGGI